MKSVRFQREDKKREGDEWSGEDRVNPINQGIADWGIRQSNNR